MSDLIRWAPAVVNRSSTSLSGGRSAPTLIQMPQDVFINICGWLSVRDILALRMSNRRIACATHDPLIWLAFLRKLTIPLPLLPATSEHRFGKVEPWTYEWLMVRALYLEQNWRRLNPVASHSRFEAFDRTIFLKMLPGGKNMVSVAKNLVSGSYSLVLWDLDHKGRRVALTGAESPIPFLKLDAAYGTVKDVPSIIIAYAHPPVQSQKGTATKVLVLVVSVGLLEILADREPGSDSLNDVTQRLQYSFATIHDTLTYGEIAQLTLGDFDGEMVLALVNPPVNIMFLWLNSGNMGKIVLGPVVPYEARFHRLLAVKLLPYQNSVLVSRVLTELGATLESTLALDMFVVPGQNTAFNNPASVGSKIIHGPLVEDCAFSDLETSWFTSLRDPKGLLPAPAHTVPPPISIFATKSHPHGLGHFLMLSEVVPNEFVQLPNGRGWVRRFRYTLPAALKADACDYFAPSMVLAGACRTVVVRRPQVHHPGGPLQGAAEPPRAGAEHGIPFFTYTARAGPASYYAVICATPRTTGNVYTRRLPFRRRTIEVAEREDSPAARREEEEGLRLHPMRIPELPSAIARDMAAGTTAAAFDESVGRLCVATVKDSGIHVLDFGGGSWKTTVALP